MRVETWQKILGKINQAILDKKNADPNFKFENINIIEELKDELKQVLSKDEYKKWEDEGFNLNHLFQVEHKEGSDEDIYNCSFMHFAACFGLEQLLNALLAAGAEVDIKVKDGETPLHNAAMFNHLDIVNILLDKGAKVNEEDNENTIPLHCAAIMGHVEVVKALLAAGAEVNARGINENTPLHYAAEKGNIKVVEALLAAGAKVNAENNEKIIPLYYAAEKGNIKVVEALLAVDGIDVNIKSKNGLTPLHYAAGEGYVKVVEALLAKDAKVNIKDKINGSTPLHRAIGSGRIDVVYALLAADAEVNAKDNYGNTQLGLAQKLANGTMAHLSADERQQWQNVVTAMQQRLEFTKKRNFAAGGATLGTAVGGAGVAAALTAVEYIPWEPKYMILTAMAIALVSLAVGYIVYHAFKEPGTKVNETQSPVKGAQENLVEC